MDIRLDERKKIPLRCVAVQIRHLDEKIALLSEDDSLVKSIIARWAHKMEGPVQCRGEICHCRHCQRQCKIFASGVNFSIFTHFLYFSH